MYFFNCDIVNYNRPHIVVLVDFTQHTKHNEGASRNEINNINKEDAKFRSRLIAHTDWVQYCISKDYLNPGYLNLIQDLPHNDQPTPDSAPSFSG